jgi:hypothetical protein
MGIFKGCGYGSHTGIDVAILISEFSCHIRSIKSSNELIWQQE